MKRVVILSALFPFVTACTADFPSRSVATDPAFNTGLEISACGDPYGGIWFDIPNSSMGEDEIQRRLSAITYAREPFKYWTFEGERRQTSLYQEVLKTFRKKPNDFTRGNIWTPIGSEVAIGEALIDADLATHYHNPKDGCGGAQISYFVVPKSVGDLKDGKIFEAFLSNKMNALVSTGAKGSVEVLPQDLVIPEYPPHFGIKPFSVKSPSATISTNLSEFTWLRFDLIFNLHSEQDTHYVVAIFAENSAEAPRVVRDTPPSDNHFRNFAISERYFVEDDIAANIAQFIGGDNNSCYVGDLATNHYSGGSEYSLGSVAADDTICIRNFGEDFG